jgi:hypothetical protein
MNLVRGRGRGNILKMHNLTGQKFGKLTFVRFLRWHNFPCGTRQPVWLLKCDCGQSTESYVNLVKRGHAKSCGCWAREQARTSHTTHGATKIENRGTKLHKLWVVFKSMQQRCNDPNSNSYQYYGAKGVKVLWTFEDFLKDMAASYSDGLTIGRNDSNGHYCKSNCRWETQAQQNRNYSRNINLTFNGKTQCLSDWASELGLLPATLESRFRKGWSTQQILSSQVDSRNRFIEVDGIKRTLSQWSEITGMHRVTISKRLKLGWSISKALTVPLRGSNSGSDGIQRS